MKPKMKIAIPAIIIILSMILEKIFPKGKNIWLIIFIVFGIIVIVNILRFYSHNGDENLTSYEDEQLEENDDNEEFPHDEDYNPYEEEDMNYYQY